jgi:non-heme chloroperoxidase
MAQVQMRDGQSLSYLDVGRGAPVVLLHGFGMRAAMWLPFIARSALCHRFILPDLRGFGASHGMTLTEPCLLTQYAHDVEDLLTGLSLDDAILGGISMGACTAMQYQQLYGFARIRAYLHMDQSPCVSAADDWKFGLFGDNHAPRMSALRALLDDLSVLDAQLPFAQVPRRLRRRVWAALAQFYRDAFHHPLWRAGAALASLEVVGSAFLRTQAWRTHLDCARSYLERHYDFRESLRRVEIPMSVFVGMKSAMYPAEGQLQIARYVPHAQIVRFENSGHAILADAPRQFGRELRRFLAAS